MKSEIAAIADQAADIIETRGLYKGNFVEDAYYHEGLRNCKVCTIGAILEVMTGDPTRFPKDAPSEELYYELRESFKSFLGDEVPDESVAAWSDHEDRTAEQVVAALRGFAVACETEAA